MRMNKKSVEMTLTTIIVFVILITFAIIYIAATTNLFGKQTDQVEKEIAKTGDSDGDGIANLFDKCDCVSGDSDNDGCPASVNPDNKDDSSVKRTAPC